MRSNTAVKISLSFLAVVFCFLCLEWRILSVATKEPEAILQTSLGDVHIKLFSTRAPEAVSNFVSLAKTGFYKKHLFHRTLPEQLVQTGDPKGDGTGGPGYILANKIPPKEKLDRPGLVAMTSVAGHSHGSQFFITLANDEHSVGGYAIFGEVTQGLEVIQKIADLRTVADRPLEEVYLQSISIQEHGWSPVTVEKIADWQEPQVRQAVDPTADKTLRALAASLDLGHLVSFELVDFRAMGSEVECKYRADFFNNKLLEILIAGQITPVKENHSTFKFSRLALTRGYDINNLHPAGQTSP